MKYLFCRVDRFREIFSMRYVFRNNKIFALSRIVVIQLLLEKINNFDDKSQMIDFLNDVIICLKVSMFQYKN